MRSSGGLSRSDYWQFIIDVSGHANLSFCFSLMGPIVFPEAVPSSGVKGKLSRNVGNELPLLAL
jgi:hypothetical protein